MKLLELYEDFFQYMCRLNRVAKTQAHPELARTRAEVKDLLARPGRESLSEVRLLNQVKRLELPMVFFIDNLICTSRLKFAPQWAEKRLASERNELAGDERFFDLLELDLADTSEDAAERLAVYYVCLGLGFTGMYQAQPEKIRAYAGQIFERIRHGIDNDPRGKISEEAYRYTNTSILTEPPSRKIIVVAIVFVFFCLSALAIYYGQYAWAVEELERSIVKIEKAGEKGKP